MRKLTLAALTTLTSQAHAEQPAPGTIQKVNPPGVAKPLGGYSHVAIVPPNTRLLYLAGQVGNRPDGTFAASYEDQTIQAWENVKAILASQGAGPEHIVKITTYAAARPTEPAKLRSLRESLFKGMMPPASTIVYVSGLARADILVEVEVIAAIPGR